MKGRVDRVSGRYMRLGMDVRGFGGGRLVYIHSGAVDRHWQSSIIRRLWLTECAAIIITGWSTVGQQSQKKMRGTKDKKYSGVG